jgi:hypothetical protein
VRALRDLVVMAVAVASAVSGVSGVDDISVGFTDV